jgi:mRNA interferase MazF
MEHSESVKTDLIHIIDWTGVKARMQTLPMELDVFPYRKEIWWASLGQNIGVEINGKNDGFERPILVIKVFNAKSLLVAPITSRVRHKKFITTFINQKGEINAVNISQMRSISTKRLRRKIGNMPEHDFRKVTEMIEVHILKTETPQSGVSSESPRREPNV